MPVEPGLTGDDDGLYMAAPPAVGRALAGCLPAGPVLELCCGLGGLTLGLAAAGRRVVAVDRDRGRLMANRANLAAHGLERQAAWLACDLTRPALRPPAWPYAAAILDPDWSPAGARPRDWASSLDAMRPPAKALARLGSGFAPRLVMRLPAAWPADDLDGLGLRQWQMVSVGGRVRFGLAYCGDWAGAALPPALAV